MINKAILDAYVQGLYDDVGNLSASDYQKIVNFILAAGNIEANPRDLIQIRRGNEADLPTLAQAECAFTLDTERFYVGGLVDNVQMPNKADITATRTLRGINAKNPPAPLIAAVGDGTTDDTPALQAMLDVLNVTGGSLYLPIGVYKISTTLIVSHHAIVIEGECANGAYIKMIGNGVPALKFSNGAATMTTCQVKNISLFKDGAASISHGIEMIKQVNVSFENVILSEFATGLKLETVGNAIFKGVGIVSNVSGAVGINSGTKSVSNYFVGCFAGFSGAAADNGIGFVANTDNIADMTIEYFDVANGAYAVVLDGETSPSGFPAADIHLKGIVADGQRVACINIVNIAEQGNIEIVNGWFNPLPALTPKAKCINISNVYNVSIIANTFQQLANTAPTIFGIAMYQAYNTLIQNNKFINVESPISCSTANFVIATGNIISLYAAQVSGSYAMLFDTTTKLSCSDNIIQGQFNTAIIAVANGNYSIVTCNIIDGSTTAVTNGHVEKIVQNNMEV